MARTLSEMLEPLHGLIEQHVERAQSFHAVKVGACDLAEQLPLIHRTGRDAWRAVFREGRLRINEAGSRAEKAHGQTHVVYAYLGSGAYPKGNIALVFEQALAEREHVMFTPFDTGALERFLVLHDESQSWDEDAEVHTLGQYQASGSCLAAFAGPYLAAHFRQPADYVRRAQVSDPDFPAYHGLVSRSGDRRAWTIEVQSPEDISLEPGGTLHSVLLDSEALWNELPSPYRGIAHVIRPDDDETSDFYTLIARWLMNYLLS